MRRACGKVEGLYEFQIVDVIRTALLASLNSIEGSVDHEMSVLRANWLISERIFSFRLFPLKRLKIKLLRYLYINPWMKPMLWRPKTSWKVSGYQLWNNRPSCCNTKWFNSGSAEMITGWPTKLVLKMGPYLIWQHVMLSCKETAHGKEKNIKYIYLYIYIAIYIEGQIICMKINS